MIRRILILRMRHHRWSVLIGREDTLLIDVCNMKVKEGRMGVGVDVL